MADVVRLRNVSKQALEVDQMGGQVVEPDCVIDIPASLLTHQRGCDGTDRSFDPETGSWPERDCKGCLHWPEETWKVESAPTTTAKDKG